MAAPTVRHRVLVKSAVARDAAMFRLAKEGIGSDVGDHIDYGTEAWYAIDFNAASDLDLDFLRPDILPPKEMGQHATR
jgi:hypothetical protein